MRSTTSSWIFLTKLLIYLLVSTSAAARICPSSTTGQIDRQLERIVEEPVAVGNVTTTDELIVQQDRHPQGKQSPCIRSKLFGSSDYTTPVHNTNEFSNQLRDDVTRIFGGLAAARRMTKLSNVVVPFESRSHSVIQAKA